MPERAIRIEGGVAYVPLTKGYEAILDVEDVPLVEGFCWRASVARRADGTVRTVYALRWGQGSNGKSCLVYLHRVLMSAPTELEVDHRDGNGLNNRKRGEAGNLRVATRSQNQHNQHIRPGNTSGFKGVTFFKRTGRWRAQITTDKAFKHIGYFKCRTSAAIAYMKASKALHGEFGRST